MDKQNDQAKKDELFARITTYNDCGEEFKMAFMNVAWFDMAQSLVAYVFGPQDKLIHRRIDDEVFIEYHYANEHKCGLIENLTTGELWTYVTKYYDGSLTELSEYQIFEREKITDAGREGLNSLVKTIAQRKVDDFFVD